MEPNGIYSSLRPEILGLEMTLHNQNPHQMPRQQQSPLHPMVVFTNLEGDYHPQPQSSKQNYSFASKKSKIQSLTLSDEDTTENSADDGKKNMSPWHRMKWTDNMVRLLIMVVFYIGDDVGSEGNDPKKKCVGGVIQKKGKWKSVSQAMLERGFYVSPQQCEDKFNDLNKRYKRVNDILGKGTACRVVENQSLLETMDHISLKMKEEVKKLLNSKHLFFREMCAYHNSCGDASGGGGDASCSGMAGLHHSPQESMDEPVQPNQKCLHYTQDTPKEGIEGSKLAKGISGDDGDDSDDDSDDRDEDEDNSMDEKSRKRIRKGAVCNSPSIEQLNVELLNLLQDGTKGALEKRKWMRMKLMGLEEEKVGILSQSFELEKQRLKWLKFSNKKEREMEREKLVNERLKLENERMVMLLRQKELDLIDHHNQNQQLFSNKRSDLSSLTG